MHKAGLLHGHALRAWAEILGHVEGKRRRRMGSKETGEQQVPRGLREAAIKAGGGGGLGRSRIGMVRGSGMSHEDGNNCGCESWKCCEAALLPRTTGFKNKQASQINPFL